jgi:hypothetical protein
MAIDSCDHGDFIVVYDFAGKINKCPVCAMEDEHKETCDDLQQQIDELSEE